MKKLVTFFLSILFMLGFCLMGFAQIQKDTFYIDPFTGVYQFDKSQHLNERSYYGLRLGYDFTKNIALEAMIGYIPTESSQQGLNNNNVKVYRYGIDALYNFNINFAKRWVPYVTVGFGRTSMWNPDKGLEEYNCQLVDYGVGIRYFANPNIAIRGEFKEDNFFKNNNFKRSQEYTVGLTFFIGGKNSSLDDYDCPEPIHLIPLVSTHFEFDSDKIVECGEQILNENIQMLKDNPKVNITIYGYASPDGNFNYNQKLSERRAESVKNYMVKNGIASNRLTAIGKGIVKHEVAIDKNSRAAREDRRVIFKINN